MVGEVLDESTQDRNHRPALGDRARAGVNALVIERPQLGQCTGEGLVHTDLAGRGNAVNQCIDKAPQLRGAGAAGDLDNGAR